jgi:ABC-type lipoprotein export system ATPase subunit
MNAVEAVDLFRIYASPEGTSVALQGLTLEVAERELLVVFGPSGSGKSTLLRILAGLDRPSAGTVRVLEHDLRTLRGRALVEYRSRTLGYADQHYTRALAPELTACQLVGLRLGLLGAPAAERERVADALRSRIGRGSSSPTSRPESSTRRTRRRSTSSCASCRARQGRRRSSSATIRNPRPWPTASSRFATAA